MPTRLQFRSHYLGSSSYDVIGGPMNGKTIKVTDSDVEMLERNWGDGTNWNMTRPEYERDVIGGAGMVTYCNGPVTDDVMEAYKGMCLASDERAEQYALKHAIEDMGPAYFAERRAHLTALSTGYWDYGWQRTAPATPLALAA